MNTKTRLEIKVFLANVADNYMQSFQGDIIYDYDTIMERLEKNGEIEVYVAKMHFDTEKRFEWHDEATVEEAREKAREHHWGEYNIMLRIEDDELKIEIERGCTPYKEFPVETVNCLIRNKITYKINNAMNEKKIYYSEEFREDMERNATYSVWVGGVEVNDYELTKKEAESLAKEYRNDGYDDVQVAKN